tara:strand:+ start:2036 stop:3184 length:1149 start_codon:yes stop_codon:yes gene_type:complete
MIPLSKPYFKKSDIKYLNNVLKSKILTDGYFQKITENLIKKKIKSKFIALTQSCTAALEISSILLNLKKNDEVILPSYGFVSLANAIALRGAKPIFVDIESDSLNISINDIKKKITKKTKAIYFIHYAGNACNMKELLKIKKKYKVFLVEDAAHAFLGKYKNKFVGTIGDIGVFSFHETKNITSGQGGCISINNKNLIKRANYILDKGTNRREFIENYKKKIINPKENKKFYSWVDLGSEYRAPELSCALLYSQIKKSSEIQKKRKKIWLKYKEDLLKIKQNRFQLIHPNKFTISTHHILGLIFREEKIANKFRIFMQDKGVAATFHYVPLHLSTMGKKYGKISLPITENVYKKVVRLPLFTDLKKKDLYKILKYIKIFFYD